MCVRVESLSQICVYRCVYSTHSYVAVFNITRISCYSINLALICVHLLPNVEMKQLI